MKNLLKKIRNKLIPTPIINIPACPDTRPLILNNQVDQRQLSFHYQYLKNNNLKLPNFNDTGFRVYSQNDEDGLLVFIFSLIGFTNKKLIDMAFGSPYGANTTNLLCNWYFHGLLVEGTDVSNGKDFFAKHSDTSIYPPKLVQSWITAENVNQLCLDNGFSGEVDLFSLDIDGVDYWIWKALDAVNPRVVVVEYVNFIPCDKSLTVPYSPNFSRFEIHEDFLGATLSAFVKLAKEKGYRLVGVNKYGFNAFFVRNDIGKEYLPEISAESCFEHQQAKDGIRDRYPKVKGLGWVEV